MTREQTFHPQLRAARFLPRTIITARTLPTLRLLTRLAARTRRPDAQVVAVDADVSVHVFRPATARPRAPALLWIHGGGMVLGDAGQDCAFCRRVADELGIVVVSVEYRLAPENPFPTPLEDCYIALQWLASQPDIDPAHIAIGGQSAGGGLAATLTLLTQERGEIRPVLQLMSYPMLDDRTTTRTDIDPHRHRPAVPTHLEPGQQPVRLECLPQCVGRRGLPAGCAVPLRGPIRAAARMDRRRHQRSVPRRGRRLRPAPAGGRRRLHPSRGPGCVPQLRLHRSEGSSLPGLRQGPDRGTGRSAQRSLKDPAGGGKSPDVVLVRLAATL